MRSLPVIDCLWVVTQNAIQECKVCVFVPISTDGAEVVVSPSQGVEYDHRLLELRSERLATSVALPLWLGTAFRSACPLRSILKLDW